MACLLEKEICGPLGSFIINKSVQLTINKQHRSDLDEILEKSHEIAQDVSRGVFSRLRRITANWIICFDEPFLFIDE